MGHEEARTNTVPVRILVVDDHPNTATTLARAISQLGPELEVIAATSGKTALEQVQKGAVDLLITDMMMPEMNGLELIEKLQPHPGGRPVYTILITAYDVPGLKVSARRLKVDEIIIKPIRPEVLCQTVHRVIEGWGSAKLPEYPTEPHQAFKVLIADDKPDNITLLSRYLSNEGYSILTAVDGVEALEETRAQLPDLILLDINMPEKDGFEVLKEIRADPIIKHIPVIILTAARIDPVDMQSGLYLGADDYVTKPFERRELMARIRTKLRAKEAEDEIRKLAEQTILRQNRLLTAAAEIASAATSTPDLNELLAISVELIQEKFGLYHASVFLVEPGSNAAVLRASAGLAGHRLPINQHQLAVGSKSLVGTATATCQPVVVMDVKNNPTHFKNPALPDTQCEAVIPLLIGEVVIGALDVQSTIIDAFSDWDITILTTIANQLAIAVQNARLSASVQQEMIKRRRAEQALQFAREVLQIQAQTRTDEFSLIPSDTSPGNGDIT